MKPIYEPKGKAKEYGKMFWMTRAGLDWLGEKLGIHIYDE